MTTCRKALTSAAVLLAVGSVAVLGALPASSAAVSGWAPWTANRTVFLHDNDTSRAVFFAPRVAPDGTIEECVTVVFGGALTSEVELYVEPGTGAPLGGVELSIERGSGLAGTGDCAGFTPDADATVFRGTLDGFGATHRSNADGLVIHPPGGGAWGPDDSVDYRFVLTFAEEDRNPVTNRLRDFVWESLHV